MVERMSVQVIQFIIGIVLARILSPTEYGTVGLLMVILAFFQVFVDSGFNMALIQKQDRSETDLSTVLFFNIFISLVCYILLWLIAPYIATFYQNELLINLTRVLALSVFLNALFSVPMTIFAINLDFKSIARTNLIAVFISGTIAIIMAYKGYGVWALVYQTIIKSLLTVILTWFQIRWKPLLIFSKESFASLFSYGSKLLISSLLGMVVNNFSNLFIAKLSSIKDLGFYSRGTQFADIVYGTFSSVIDSVLMPTLSTIQNERERLIELTRSAIKTAGLIVIPILLGMAVIAEPLIKFLLTDKWIMAVPIMQIFCLARLISIISGINVNVLYAIGRTDLALKQQYLKLLVRVLLLVVAFRFGIVYIALAELISTIIHFFINTYYPSKILKYGPIEQIKDLFPIILSSIVMAIFIYFSILFIDSNFLKLIIALVVALASYFLSIYLLGFKEFFTLINKVKLIVKNER